MQFDIDLLRSDLILSEDIARAWEELTLAG